jgi:hypothetical protein
MDAPCVLAPAGAKHAPATNLPSEMSPAERAPLLVLGTREFSVEIADIADQTGRFRVVGFVENLSRERCADSLEGLPIHWIDDVGELAATHLAVCGLGTTRRGIFTEQAAERGLRFATIVHRLPARLRRARSERAPS